MNCKCTKDKNQVIKVKNACGLWLNDQQAIAAKLITDYDQRLSLLTQNLISLGLASIVSKDDNLQLMKVPDQQEIKHALFSIDSNKRQDLMVLEQDSSRSIEMLSKMTFLAASWNFLGMENS